MVPLKCATPHLRAWLPSPGEVQSPPGPVSREVCAQLCGGDAWRRRNPNLYRKRFVIGNAVLTIPKSVPYYPNVHWKLLVSCSFLQWTMRGSSWHALRIELSRQGISASTSSCWTWSAACHFPALQSLSLQITVVVDNVFFSLVYIHVLQWLIWDEARVPETSDLRLSKHCRVAGWSCIFEPYLNDNHFRPQLIQ